MYSYYQLDGMPDVSLLSQFNRFIFAFWMSERGAVDGAQQWASYDPATRQSVSLGKCSDGLAGDSGD